MNAVLKVDATIDRRTRAQKIAIVCDYLRSKKGDESSWLDNFLLLEDNRRGMQDGANQTARDLLDTMESLNASAVGDFFINRLIANALKEADEQ